MKIKLIVSLGLCCCAKSLIGYPVCDEQKRIVCDNKFQKIDYQKLEDYDFFKNLIRGNDINSINQEIVFSELRKLQQIMDDSVLKFLTEIQNTTDVNDFSEKIINLTEPMKKILNRDTISLASAIWIYQVIFLSEEDFQKYITKNFTMIETNYDNYLESLN